ncbi:MAG: glycolate oxidase iron-sulfur subunit [Gammaproteobacteria bacterium]|nr:MAG: glycolate oxidase iron-sulfur subunit [Gammaproteobacteria bacterium]
MQTALPPAVLDTPDGREADRILRSCVHCGFCTAVCPTYQLLGNEMDGPRGRIYLIKQLLEGQPAGSETRLHLDRCLTCRACEASCPSSTRYARLLDIGRERLEATVRRPPKERMTRRLLRLLLLRPLLLRTAIAAGRLAAPLLPRRLRLQLGRGRKGAVPPPVQGHRRMILLRGCAQPALAPEIDAAAIRLLSGLGISLEALPGSGCCGALSHHLGAVEEGRALARRNIECWSKALKDGAEGIIATASGCALHLREYDWVMRGSGEEGAAAGVAGSVVDLAALLLDEAGDCLRRRDGVPQRIAFQVPCTLQHGLGEAATVRRLLERAGFTLTEVREEHLCCGSAGSYSLLQPEIARSLLECKLAALEQGGAELIATANIGCLLHLRGDSRLPVRHWLELIELCPEGTGPGLS